MKPSSIWAAAALAVSFAFGAGAPATWSPGAPTLVMAHNGFAHDQNQGWTAQFHFGSKQAAQTRLHASVASHADFISTDQYEDVAQAIRRKH